jgi:hypothetical protein
VGGRRGLGDSGRGGKIKDETRRKNGEERRNKD